VIDRQPKEFDMLRGLFKQKKTDNVIEVLLGKEPGTLDINNHEVSHNGLKQVIIWQLAKKLQSGNFTGFEWVDPTGITSTFDTPEISADGNSLTIGDHNGSTAKKGRPRLHHHSRTGRHHPYLQEQPAGSTHAGSGHHQSVAWLD
jgi:hypothetical protein